MARTVRFHELGGPEVLLLEDLDVAEPGPGEVLLDVEAIGLNTAEARFRRGRYLEQPRRLPSGLGCEAAGTVAAVGEGVAGLRPGDAVSVVPAFSMNDYPVYAERAVVPAHAVVARPHGVDAVTGAAVWMAFLTVYGALLDVVRLRAGDTVVITAAHSSVGLAAVQLARRVGAEPVAVLAGDRHRERVRAAGAEHVLTERDDLVEHVGRITGGRGAEVVFDAVAGPGVDELARVVAPDGMLIVHGRDSGEPTPFPGLAEMRPVLARAFLVYEITGDPERLRRAVAFVTSGLRTGAFVADVDRTFALEDIVAAHRHHESAARVGKVVVTTAR